MPVIVYYHVDQREILIFPSEIKFGISPSEIKMLIINII